MVIAVMPAKKNVIRNWLKGNMGGVIRPCLVSDNPRPVSLGRPGAEYFRLLGDLTEDFDPV